MPVAIHISRRDFLKGCAACGLGLAAGPVLAAPGISSPHGEFDAMPVDRLREAMFWETVAGGRARCLICPHRCERGEGEVTACHTRMVRGGRLYSLTHGRPCTLCVDPLAKNPLYHVAPGSEAIGVATAGCNLTCAYCQNWDVSQTGPWATKNTDVSPRDLVRKAMDRGLKWITFSYTEPVAYYEYAIDVAKAARRQGVRVAVATAGYIEEAPLKELARWTDAFSVTLKGYAAPFYRDVIGCAPDAVWRSIRAIQDAGNWMEVVTLVIPGLNDDATGLASLARGLAAVNRDIPLHFLRFAPAYKLQHLPPTPVRTLEQAHASAKREGLRFVYLDLSGHRASGTYCPGCGETLIERAGFKVLRNDLKRDRCPKCSLSIPGIFR